MGEVVWKCFHCDNTSRENKTRKRKLVGGYLDVIICILEDNRKKLLQLGNNLQNNWQFRIYEMNQERELPFFKKAVYVHEQRAIFHKLYGNRKISECF